MGDSWDGRGIADSGWIVGIWVVGIVGIVEGYWGIVVGIVEG